MKIVRSLQVVILALSSLMAFQSCGAQAPAAKVNGVTIPQSRVDILVKNAAAQGQPDSPDLRTRIRDELITREVILQEAAKKGFDKNPDIAIQMDMQRESVLINAYLQDYVKNNPVTEDAMKKEYETAKAQMGATEYRVHHILVKDENTAKQIIAQLKKGGNFEKIATDKSEDTGSKAKGGDLDWSPATRYVKPFGDALAKLKKGQITDTPVQTQFGWHIIRLDDTRPAKIPSYDDVKANIQQSMQQQVVQKAIADLRAKAKIE